MSANRHVVKLPTRAVPARWSRFAERSAFEDRFVMVVTSSCMQIYTGKRPETSSPTAVGLVCLYIFADTASAVSSDPRRLPCIYTYSPLVTCTTAKGHLG